MNHKATPVPDVSEAGGGQEIRWPLRHLTLAGLHWPKTRVDSSAATPVVMVHGWLDNARTFVRLAPELAGTRDVFAIDMAGHGHSDHRPAGQSYLLVDYVADLAELLANHFDEPVDLVSHSLGGTVSLLCAAAFPERVRRLVMIDSLGPITRPPEQVLGQLRSALVKREQGSSPGPLYPSQEQAARVRAGGLSPLSQQAAEELVPRNLVAVDGGYRWRTDPRLRHPSSMQFDEQQVLAMLTEVNTSALLLVAENGLLPARPEMTRRLDAIRSLRKVSVPGGHHCHLDGEIAPVSQHIKEFLDDDSQN